MLTWLIFCGNYFCTVHHNFSPRWWMRTMDCDSIFERKNSTNSKTRIL